VFLEAAWMFSGCALAVPQLQARRRPQRRWGGSSLDGPSLAAQPGSREARGSAKPRCSPGYGQLGACLDPGPQQLLPIQRHAGAAAARQRVVQLLHGGAAQLPNIRLEGLQGAACRGRLAQLAAVKRREVLLTVRTRFFPVVLQQERTAESHRCTFSR
jgi:hypothetical protein